MSMTESEAIEYLSNRYLVVGSPVNPPKEECEKHNAIMDMAIRALEEVQRYREYREIFENQFSNDVLKLLSDKEEFAKWLERGRWLAKKCDELGREVEEYRAIGTVKVFETVIKSQMDYFYRLREYEKIGTVSEFRELKEKAKAKKPKKIKRHRGGFEMEHCPNCDTDYQVDRRFEVEEDYCGNCGKLLDSSFINFCANCGCPVDMRKGKE